MKSATPRTDARCELAPLVRLMRGDRVRHKHRGSGVFEHYSSDSESCYVLFDEDHKSWKVTAWLVMPETNSQPTSNPQARCADLLGVTSWLERVPMLSIHPDAATRHDVANLAAELMEARRLLCLVWNRVQGQNVDDGDKESAADWNKLSDEIGTYLDTPNDKVSVFMTPK